MTTTIEDSSKRKHERNDDNEESDAPLIISNQNNCETPTNKKKRTRKRKSQSAVLPEPPNDEEENVVVTTVVEKKERIDLPNDHHNDNDTDTNDTELDRTVYMEGIPFAATYEQILNFLTRVVVVEGAVMENDNDDPTGTTTTNNNNKNKKKTRDPNDPGRRTHIHRDDILDVRLATWQDTGRYRGYGHVVYATRDARQFALQHYHRQYFYKSDNQNNNNNNDKNDSSSNNHKPNNRYISMTAAVTPRGGNATTTTAPKSAPSPTIILRNLSYHATEADIHEALTTRLLLQPQQPVVPKDTNHQKNDTSSSSSSGKITIPTVESGNIRVVRHSIPPYHSKGLAYITFDNIDDATYCMNRITTTTTTPVFLIHERPVVVDYDHGRIRGSFRTAQHTFWSTTHRGNQLHNNNNSSSSRHRK